MQVFNRHTVYQRLHPKLKINNSFSTIAPNRDDKYVTDIILARLEKAFRMIALRRRYPWLSRTANSRTPDKVIAIDINIRDGSFEIAGHTLVHFDKLSDEVIRLLEKYKLISYKAGDIARLVGSHHCDQFAVVDNNAANLIVSHLADNIAQRVALSTITDQDIDFMVSSLNAIHRNYEQTKRARNILASLVLKFEIPEEIESLNYRQYKELRDNYQDIRGVFHEEMSRLTSLHELDQINDIAILKERIGKVSRNFNDELQKFKKSRRGKQVKKWLPLGIGSLATMAGAFVQSPSVMVLSAGVTVGVNFVQEIIKLREPAGESREVQRLFSGLQKDIINKTKLTKLI